MNALIIANYEIKELMAMVTGHMKNQDERLREISVQILSDPTNVTQLAVAERQGQHLARPIMEQGQLVRFYSGHFLSRDFIFHPATPRTQATSQS